MNPGQTAAAAAKMRALLPVMDAFARGEKIEFRDQGQPTWKSVESPSWVSSTEYRVKPQPRTIYVFFFGDGSFWSDNNKFRMENKLKESGYDISLLSTFTEVL